MTRRAPSRPSLGPCGPGCALRDAVDHVRGVARSADHEYRRAPVLEDQPEEVQAGRRHGDAAIVLGRALVVEDRHADPAVVGAESGGPDDVGHLDDPAIGKDGLAVLHADRAAVHQLDAGPLEVGTPMAQERRAALPQPWAPSSGRCGRTSGGSWRRTASPARRCARRDCRPTTAAGRAPGRTRSSDGRRRDLHREIGSSVAEADDEHRTRSELGRAPVVARVQLHDGRIEVRGERGRARHAKGARGDHHLGGLERPVGRRDHEPVARPILRVQRLDANAGRDRETELVPRRTRGSPPSGGRSGRRGEAVAWGAPAGRRTSPGCSGGASRSAFARYHRRVRPPRGQRSRCPASPGHVPPRPGRWPAPITTTS